VSVALVTGAGRGIGRAVSIALAREGTKLGLLARSREQLAATSAAVSFPPTSDPESGAAEALTLELPADVTDHGAVREAVQLVRDELGPIDVLINNAGIAGPPGPLWETDREAYWNTIRVSLEGTYNCLLEVLPEMVARDRGRIVNVVSHAGVVGWTNVSSYAVAKAGVIRMTEDVAAELRGTGVSVFAFHPGVVEGGLTDGVFEREPEPGSLEAKMQDWFARKLAAGEGVSVERVADYMVDLVSGRADALSGRYLTAYDDLDALVAAAGEIRRADLQVLRLREWSAPHGGE
jgi:NAD(P)-dependent dehydrogenase (short-subunit alcohol dehydrogenase family)